MRGPIFLPLIVALAGPHSAAEAQVTGVRGTADRQAVVDMGEMPKAESPAGIQFGIPRPLAGPAKHNGRPGTGYVQPPRKLGGSGSVTNLDISPLATGSFLALGDDDTVIPPDTYGSVGTNFIVVALNRGIRYMDRTGGVIQTMSLSSFWSSLGNPDPFDPRVLYDPYANRWIMTADADPQSPSSSVLIAVSATSAPTGTWHMFRIDADPGNTNWADYDSVGFDKDWIVIHTHMFTFSDAFVGAQIYCFDKTNLYAGATNGAYTFFAVPGIFGLVPTENYDPTIERMYLMEEWDIGQGQVRVSHIDGPVGAETFTLGAFTSSVPAVWAGQPPDPEFSPQLGLMQQIDAGDSRIQQLVYRNSNLWVTQTFFTPTDVVTRAGVQWYEMTTNGDVLQFGRIEDTNNIAMFTYPSIGVNARDDALIGCSVFAPRATPSAVYFYRAASDPANTMRYPRLMKAGDDAYYKPNFSGSENRWGDYSHTMVDPLDDTSFWTIQEYAAPRSGIEGMWGTWWARVGAPTNHAPRIELPGPITLPVGASTSFTVTVSDPDGQSVTLVNSVAPSGATFVANTFSWTSTPSFANTTNTVAFQSDDGQGEYNSLVTNSATIAVPYDSDGDFISDAWEFQNFGTLTNPATADPDGDGANNFIEYVSGTDPTNANSAIEVQFFVQANATGQTITAATQPAHRYFIEYSDSAPSDSATWSAFINAANGFGTWFETNTVPATFTFVDDQGTNSTGAASSTGRRAYRVRTLDTNVNYTVFLREQTNGIAVDGVVSPAEYGTTALYRQGTNDGFGQFNHIGDFFAAYASNTFFIGLQGATLENNGQNGIVIYISSPKLYQGWQNPALGADQGEVGDFGTPAYAESLLTRANVSITNTWNLPGDDFADLGFGIVDLGANVSQFVSVVHGNMGLYKFALPQNGNNLGWIPSTAVWNDTFTTNGGLEFSVSFADLGGVTTGDVIQVVAFITSITGFTSDETLPANLLGSGSPGFGTAFFSNAVMSLQIGGSRPP